MIGLEETCERDAAIREHILSPSNNRTQEERRQISEQPGNLNAVNFNTWGAILGGSALVGLGLARRGTIGLLACGIGGTIAYRGWQKYCEASGSCSQWGHHDPALSSHEDGVDEASWESFPASDPPSFSPITSFG